MAKKRGFWNIFVPVETQIFEKITGRSVTAKKEDSADEYVNTKLPIMEAYTGSKASWDLFKSQQADSCASFVKSKGVMVGQNPAREVCVSKINMAYSGISMAMEEEAYLEEQQVKGEFLAGDTTIYIIAIIAIVIILILKYY